LDGYASAVAAGSLFVFHGARRAVLINYPTQEELIEIFHEDSD
jgi:cyclase